MSTTIVSISLPKEEVQRVDALATQNSCSRSQLIQQAIKHYAFELEWRKIRSVGDQISKRLGIESDDDVERLAA